ncbi:DUF4349 domain-containing protein [Methanolobus psychrotolerans]|uniref:DUF4349 domain-containing protein n=1 Tax=Methanolobus psychrotolerans TaxID=1874706 RepID=UPI000B91A237|nr:DUF4349 domain-containing protein [Methanolobus psychrotolerans]
MKIKSISIILILLMATLVSGCMAVKEESYAQSADTFSVEYEEAYDDSSARTVAGGGADNGVASSVDRKTITTVDMTIQVNDAAAGVDEISKMAVAAGGYVSGSSIYDSYYSGSDTRKEGYVTVRVPESGCSSFLGKVEILGEVTHKSVNAQDVTEEYIDVKARLDNLQRQETRLQEILNMTKTVEEVLNVEKELGRVRGEIESFTGRLNYLEDRIEFSTINIRLTEPRPITHSWGIRDAVSESVRGFIAMVNALIILVGYLLPLLIVVTVFVGIILIVRKRVRK